MRSRHASPETFWQVIWYLSTKHVRFHLQKIVICSLWGELRSYYPVLSNVWLPFSIEIFVSFSIFEILLCTAAAIFCVGNGLSLTYLSVAPKFYSSSIPLNEIWSCLHSKYFGRLSHIYQLNIVRLHLWRSGIYSSWGGLRSHYTVCLRIWLPFSKKKIGKFYLWSSLWCSSNC